MHSVAKRPLGYLILITPLLRSAAVKITFLFILRFPEFLIYRAECQGGGSVSKIASHVRLTTCVQMP